MRAYGEINRFERQLHDWGAVVHKFMLHIDKYVQLQRFRTVEYPPKEIQDHARGLAQPEKWDAYKTR
jgi:polyphosphate kinase 2 (PPK2 family)